jgi:transposase
MPPKYRKFSPEFRDEAVRQVIEHSRPSAQVARELGVNEGTLGGWVKKYRDEHAGEEPPFMSDSTRLDRLAVVADIAADRGSDMPAAPRVQTRPDGRLFTVASLTSPSVEVAYTDSPAR